MNLPTDYNIDDEDSAARIRLEMSLLRGDLKEEFDDVTAQAKELTDWRYYVHQAPAVCFSVAALAGYVLTPKRVPIRSVDASSVRKLAKDNRVVVQSRTKAERGVGLGGMVMRMLATAAVRSAIGYASQQMSERSAREDQQNPNERGMR